MPHPRILANGSVAVRLVKSAKRPAIDSAPPPLLRVGRSTPRSRMSGSAWRWIDKADSVFAAPGRQVLTPAPSSSGIRAHLSVCKGRATAMRWTTWVVHRRGSVQFIALDVPVGPPLRGGPRRFRPVHSPGRTGSPWGNSSAKSQVRPRHPRRPLCACLLRLRPARVAALGSNAIRWPQSRRGTPGNPGRSESHGRQEGQERQGQGAQTNGRERVGRCQAETEAETPDPVTLGQQEHRPLLFVSHLRETAYQHPIPPGPPRLRSTDFICHVAHLCLSHKVCGVCSQQDR